VLVRRQSDEAWLIPISLPAFVPGAGADDGICCAVAIWRKLEQKGDQKALDETGGAS